jgi:DNA topoisomerase I
MAKVLVRLQPVEEQGPAPPHSIPDTTSVVSAKSAGLRYVSDDRLAGIRRKRIGKAFTYMNADGKPFRDAEDIRRIKSLVIPPAWTDVWICPIPNGHIQATARDAKGRKQYRYHPRWRMVRDVTKYDRMTAFGQILPLIRRRAEQDLARPGLPRKKILATVVRLLESTLIRVGNEEYARQNDSFGLTTMRDRHVDVSGSTLRFAFRGKSGIQHSVDLTDRRLARIVKRSQDLPGQELFQYLDVKGKHHSIGSSDVNEYLREITKQDFTAKDFRTWAGTVLAATALQEFEAWNSKAQAKRNVVRAIESVAKRLGNTRAVCKKCYIHPAILSTYLDGSLLQMLRRRIDKEMRESLSHLRPEEAAVLALLQYRMKQDARERHRNGHTEGNPRKALGPLLKQSVRAVRRAKYGKNGRRNLKAAV